MARRLCPTAVAWNRFGDDRRPGHDARDFRDQERHAAARRPGAEVGGPRRIGARARGALWRHTGFLRSRRAGRRSVAPRVAGAGGRASGGRLPGAARAALEVPAGARRGPRGKERARGRRKGRRPFSGARRAHRHSAGAQRSQSRDCCACSGTDRRARDREAPALGPAGLRAGARPGDARHGERRRGGDRGRAHPRVCAAARPRHRGGARECRCEDLRARDGGRADFHRRPVSDGRNAAARGDTGQADAGAAGIGCRGKPAGVRSTEVTTTPSKGEAMAARTVVVTSGKGGVGKTTTSASFASGRALRGHKTAVIDFDVGLRNLDLIMGCERRVVYDLVNVINGEANLHQALIKDKHCENLSVLAASQTRDKEALTKEGVEKVLGGLSDLGFEYIVCDSPAGIETGAMMAMHFADEALVVTNPEVSSVRDSDRILGMLASKTKRAIEGGEPVKEHLLITRYNTQRVHQGEMLSIDDIQDILRIKLLGVIPESESVLQSSNQGVPAVHMQGADVSEAYKDTVDRFLGEEKPLRFVNGYKPGFFKRLFGGN